MLTCVYSYGLSPARVATPRNVYVCSLGEHEATTRPSRLFFRMSVDHVLLAWRRSRRTWPSAPRRRRRRPGWTRRPSPRRRSPRCCRRNGRRRRRSAAAQVRRRRRRRRRPRPARRGRSPGAPARSCRHPCLLEARAFEVRRHLGRRRSRVEDRVGDVLGARGGAGHVDPGDARRARIEVLVGLCDVAATRRAASSPTGKSAWASLLGCTPTASTTRSYSASTSFPPFSMSS